MKFIFSPSYGADIGAHVFPTEKYHLIHKRLKQDGLITGQNVIEPEKPSEHDLLKIIDQEYLDDLVNARLSARTFPSEMPVNHDIIQAQILCCGGSFLAAKNALECGLGYHIGGGFHHAFRDHAEGFCYLNDVVFAAVMMLEQNIERIAVVDCDLHQGNGTAKFFQGETRVFTFSMHQEHLYPKKEKSDLDIGLDQGVADKEYLEKLNTALDIVYDIFKPQLVIYLAGADPYIFDQLGSLDITAQGLKRRDKKVVSRAAKQKIPVAVVLGGGYAQNIDDTVEIHCNTARVMHDEERFYT